MTLGSFRDVVEGRIPPGLVCCEPPSPCSHLFLSPLQRRGSPLLSAVNSQVIGWVRQRWSGEVPLLVPRSIRENPIFSWWGRAGGPVSWPPAAGGDLDQGHLSGFWGLPLARPWTRRGGAGMRRSRRARAPSPARRGRRCRHVTASALPDDPPGRSPATGSAIAARAPHRGGRRVDGLRTRHGLADLPKPLGGL